MALTNKLTAIANAIRTKTGGSTQLSLDDMVTEIEGISGGGATVDWDNLPSYNYLNEDFRFNDILPSSMSLGIKNNGTASKKKANLFLDKIKYVSLPSSLSNLTIDFTDWTTPSTSAWFTGNLYSLISTDSILPTVNIINPNSITLRYHTAGSNTIDITNIYMFASFFGTETTGFITLENKDIPFIKQIMKLFEFQEGVTKKWYGRQTRSNNYIFSMKPLSNPQLLIDNIKFDTTPDTGGMSYFGVINRFFGTSNTANSISNFYVDQGAYNTANHKYFYIDPNNGLAYNFFINYLPPFTFEMENNQPITANFSNQVIPFISGGYYGTDSWTKNAVINFLNSLPDTTSAGGNNTIQMSSINHNSLGVELREYLQNIPTEMVASLSDRGYSISIS